MDVVDLGAIFYDIVSLLAEIFGCLQGIHPSYLLHRIVNTCDLAPYFPSWFARQFGYVQIYVGNPYKSLAHRDSLIDGTRAWRLFIML